MSSIDVHRHPDEFPQDVRQLLASAEAISVEFGATWHRNLVDTVYQNHPGVRFYVLRHGGHPVACLPVLIEKNMLAKRAHSLANFYSALYAPAIAVGVRADELVALLQEIRRTEAPLGSFRFAPMDPDSSAYHLLHEALRGVGFVPFQFFCFGNWFLTVENTWPTYLAGRDGVLRSTIKRMGKKFATAGGVLELVQGGEALDKGLQAYERVYAASWKVAEPYPNFMPGLIRVCAERGWLRLGIAWLNNEPIAAQFWFIANGKASIYKLAYHEDHKAYAPGTLLTAMLTQYAIEIDGVSEIDYLIGDDPYKKTWMDNRRERRGLIAYNTRSIAGLWGLCLEVMGRMLKSARVFSKKIINQMVSPAAVVDRNGVP